MTQRAFWRSVWLNSTTNVGFSELDQAHELRLPLYKEFLALLHDTFYAQTRPQWQVLVAWIKSSSRLDFHLSELHHKLNCTTLTPGKILAVLKEYGLTAITIEAQDTLYHMDQHLKVEPNNDIGDMAEENRVEDQSQWRHFFMEDQTIKEEQSRQQFKEVEYGQGIIYQEESF